MANYTLKRYKDERLTVTIEKYIKVQGDVSDPDVRKSIENEQKTNMDSIGWVNAKTYFKEGNEYARVYSTVYVKDESKIHDSIKAKVDDLADAQPDTSKSKEGLKIVEYFPKTGEIKTLEDALFKSSIKNISMGQIDKEKGYKGQTVSMLATLNKINKEGVNKGKTMLSFNLDITNKEGGKFGEKYLKELQALLKVLGLKVNINNTSMYEGRHQLSVMKIIEDTSKMSEENKAKFKTPATDLYNQIGERVFSKIEFSLSDLKGNNPFAKLAEKYVKKEQEQTQEETKEETNVEAPPMDEEVPFDTPYEAPHEEVQPIVEEKQPVKEEPKQKKTEKQPYRPFG